MSTNPLNDISRVYLDQIASVDEAAKPDYLDFDKDGNKKESMKKALKDKKKVEERFIPPSGEEHKIDPNRIHLKSPNKNMDDKVKQLASKDDDESHERARNIIKARLRTNIKAKGLEIAKKVEEANDGNLANNYPPYDKVTRGDVIAGRLGKDQMGGKKKKSVKEGYSNWRQDLAEVVSDVEDSKKIKEKKIENKVVINPKINEAVEEIGGTLLEMVEIDEFDFVVESVYSELLEEGYGEDDIEDALEYALTEAKVTFGHDTSVEKKKSGLMAAAKQKLANVKKAAKQAVATGARKVAKGALSVARKVEGGDAKPSAAQTKTRSASTYRGAGVGQKERVSSGSYTPPAKKKAEKPSDPWEGSATTPTKAKTKKAAAPKAKAPAKKKKSGNLDNLLASIRNEETSIERIDRISKEKVAQRAAIAKKEKESRASSAAAFQAHKKEVLAKGGRPVDALDSWQKMKMKKEEVDLLDEKTLSKKEMSKREELVKSMKKRATDFEKRYPGRGKEVMYATATKMAKKMAEEIAPTTTPDSSVEKKGDMLDKTKLANLKMLQQKQQMLQRQKLQMQKTGKLPLEASYEPDGEMIDERRRAEKGTPRAPEPSAAFKAVAAAMGSSRLGVQPRGNKKTPGQKPPAAGEYGAPRSPAQKVAMRRAAAQRSQDMYKPRAGESD